MARRLLGQKGMQASGRVLGRADGKSDFVAAYGGGGGRARMEDPYQSR